MNKRQELEIIIEMLVADLNFIKSEKTSEKVLFSELKTIMKHFNKILEKEGKKVSKC